MYCSYHTTNTARVQCSSCSRALCSACDHRIKGSPYCQDCIVLGVQGLSRTHYSPKPRGSARFAALLALLPGMGAVYNRQNIKGIAHFATIVSLFQLTGIRFASAIFALGGLSFYIYSIVDAYRTAQLIAQGEDPAVDEARFKRSLIKRAPVIGVVLLTAGLLLVIQIARPFPLVTFARLLPVAFIILGGYLLTRYFKRPSEESYERGPKSPPYSLVPGDFSNRSEHNTSERNRPHSAGRR
jgi:TM2 domain-containing membrane protein YozV